MTSFGFVIKSFIHYFRYNLTVAVGVAISTAVLTGALIIGDSVRFSLEKAAVNRLGKTTYALTAGDRFFTAGLADRLQNDLGFPCIPLLVTEGVAVPEGGGGRVNNIRINGVNSKFDLLSDHNTGYGNLNENEVLISDNLALKLNLKKDDTFLLRIKKTSLIPLNAPFVSDEETSISVRMKVKDLVRAENLGHFNLRNSQTAPFNVFVSLDFLNGLMKIAGKSNTILFAVAGDGRTEEISTALRKNWSFEDANLKLRYLNRSDELEIISERVFIEPAISEAFSDSEGYPRWVITYFVNSFRKDDRETPYSFVSTIDGDYLKKGEILVNQWLADDLALHKGDMIELKYFSVGPLRQLVEETASFTVKDIVSLSGIFQDSSLMPFLPGLSDAGSCRDWEAGIPIDLDKIRNKDEEYWNRWRGTPKAFIHPDAALELWKNRFGDYTAIRFNADEINEQTVETLFRGNLDPASLGFIVRNVREEAQNAARNGVNFSQLFIGLSFFVLISAVLLTGLLFYLNMMKRSVQAGTLAAFGFSHRLIRRLFLMEGIIIAFFGAMFGVLLAVIYNKVILLLLNDIWSDIVRISILEMKLNVLTMAEGFIICIIIAVLMILLFLRQIPEKTIEMQKGITVREKHWVKFLVNSLAVLTGLTGSGILIQQGIKGELNTLPFFAAGSLFLIALLLFNNRILRYFEKRLYSFSKISHLVLRNIVRNQKRSYAIIVLFALGTFIIVATGSNRKDMTVNADDKHSGTGGFSFFAESTMPVLHDLNNKEVRIEYGLEEEYTFIPFSRSEGDDASCLNLNRIQSPVILGVDPESLKGRFSFISITAEVDKSDPWSALDRNLYGGVIPAVADQTVIQWGLGKKAGDTLMYLNSSGDTMMLKLVGGLAPSVFQGNVIISDRHFLQNYPSSSGSSVFLVEPLTGNDSTVEADFSRAMRDWGWEMSPTTDRLAEFYSVENTYLSIFLMLGILSLVIGTAGLGIMVARSIMERKSEIGLLQALGFKQSSIYRIIFTEYFILLICGIMIGFITAVISTLPGLMSMATDISLSNLLVIIIILIMNGVIWIGLFTRIYISQDLVLELKTE